MLKKIDKTIGDHLVAKKHQNKLQFFYKDKMKNGMNILTIFQRYIIKEASFYKSIIIGSLALPTRS